MAAFAQRRPIYSQRLPHQTSVYQRPTWSLFDSLVLCLRQTFIFFDMSDKLCSFSWGHCLVQPHTAWRSAPDLKERPLSHEGPRTTSGVWRISCSTPRSWPGLSSAHPQTRQETSISVKISFGGAPNPYFMLVASAWVTNAQHISIPVFFLVVANSPQNQLPQTLP